VYAEKAALHIGSKHTSVICTDQEFLDAIPEVIWAIESYDVTTVRASIGNYLVGKFIAKNTDFRVVFNGDYADEVMGGYLYFHNAPSALEFHKETIRLVTDIHYFDSLRSDRTISCHGLEARAPYSDKAFVDFYMRIPHELRMPSKTGVEKNLIRNAFSCIRADILPSSILNRRKEAFSDGVSNANTSWHEILQKYADTKISDEYFVSEKKKFEHNAPLTKEALIYRQIFELHFHTHEHMIPYGWMPKWVGNVSDPSARVLSMY
jgi:asparagine synthase (glutamine-hydrolysing)